MPLKTEPLALKDSPVSSPEFMRTVTGAACAKVGKTLNNRQTKQATIVSITPVVRGPMRKRVPRAALNLILVIFIAPPSFQHGRESLPWEFVFVDESFRCGRTF